MESQEVKKLSLKLYSIRENLKYISSLKNLDESTINIQSYLSQVEKDLKKIDATILKENKVKFSDAEKKKVFEYSELMK